jgi:hypothetical protein
MGGVASEVRERFAPERVFAMWQSIMEKNK